VPPLRSVLLVVLACLIGGCATGPRGVPRSEDIDNFGRISETLFRGAQPDERGMASLQRLGVRTIVNLRMPDDVWPPEPLLAREKGIAYINVPLSGVWAPTEAQVRQVLSLIETSPGPVFVHCQHGADRTGTVIACYRIEHDGWPAERAQAEANRYGMSRLLSGMRNFVRTFRPAVKP
jgi:protein tyrosine phosphatase (PTP) superfamily phosphohydrolase (DUF442 family)